MLATLQLRIAAATAPLAESPADYVGSVSAPLRQAEPRAISAAPVAATRAAGEPMMFTSLQRRIVYATAPLVESPADYVGSVSAPLRHAEPRAISAVPVAATRAAGEPMMFTSLQRRIVYATAPLIESPADYVGSLSAPLRHAEPREVSTAPMAATRVAGEPRMLISLRPRFAEATAPLPESPADYIGSVAAPLRQTEPPVMSATPIAAITAIGEPMVFISLQRRFADATAPLIEPSANYVGSVTASLGQTEAPVISAAPMAATRAAADPMVFTCLRRRFADATAPLIESSANYVGSGAAPLRHTEAPVISAASMAATCAAGRSMMFTSLRRRLSDATAPLTEPPADYVGSVAVRLRQTGPSVMSAIPTAATRTADEPMVFTSLGPRFADATALLGPLADLVRSAAAERQPDLLTGPQSSLVAQWQIQRAVPSAPPIATTRDTGDPMIFTSPPLRFADTTATLTGPLADVVVRSAVARRQTQHAAPAAPLMAAAPGVREPIVFTSLQPWLADTTGPLAEPLHDLVSAVAISPRRAEHALANTPLIAANRRTGEPIMLSSEGTMGPFIRSAMVPEFARRHASVAGMRLVGLSGQTVVNGLSAHRAFDDSRSSLHFESQDAPSSASGRGHLPLRAVQQRYPTVMPTARAADAPIHAMTPIVAGRGEAPGSVPYRLDLTPAAGIEGPAPVSSRFDTPPRSVPHDAAADADEIVERAWREVMSRLAIEQERRGFGRWS
jgi:hypothetical protein